MEFDFVSLVPAGDDGLAQVVLAKTAGSDEHGMCVVCGKKHKGKNYVHKSADDTDTSHTIRDNTSMEERMTATPDLAGLDPEVREYIEGLEADNTELTEAVTKAEAENVSKDTEITELRDTLSKSAPKDAESQEEITKALLAKADPAVRALIEKTQADLAKSDAIAKAEREIRLGREFLSKAEAMPMLAAEPTEEGVSGKQAMASLLRRAADALAPDDFASLEKVLKTANTQITKGNLFSTLGSGGGETTISKSVTAMAGELRKQNPALTQEQAEAEVYSQNPDLYDQVLNGEGA